MCELNKIYVEPTNRCNLTCITCIRNSWEENLGDMDWSVYQVLMESLDDFPNVKTIAFAGLGEPLLHERFVDMVSLAHKRGLRTEMTSNAMLLNRSIVVRLLDAGLDQFVVSIDGATDRSQKAIRTGASLTEITNNVRMLYRMSAKKTKRLTGTVLGVPSTGLKTLFKYGLYFGVRSECLKLLKCEGVPVAEVKNAFGTACKRAEIEDFRFHD